MARSYESPMDFQYENPIQPDPNSPFRLTNMGKALNFASTEVSSNSLKRTTFTESSGTPYVLKLIGSRLDTPTKPLPFTFNTPRTIPNTNAIFTPSITARNPSQDTPGTDNTEEVTDDGGPSEQESPMSFPTRSTKRNKLSELGKIKMRRRRQKHKKDFEYDHYSDEDDPNDDLSTVQKSSKHSPSAQSWNSSAHRDLPYIASGYLQLFCNLFLIGVVLYFLVSFIMTIQADVNKKVEEYSAEILSEISICSKEYLENRCSPTQRVPAMQMACQAWERCMDRDPALVGRARVSAETFAEIINSLIEPISYKTMTFCLVLLFGSLFMSNFAFGLLRHKQSQSAVQPQNPVPATFMIQAGHDTRQRRDRSWG